MSERFIVRESSGYRIPPPGSFVKAVHLRPVTEVLVMDRAYCYRVVWSSETTLARRTKSYDTNWRGNKHHTQKSWYGTAKTWSLERRREYARELAERLNAEAAQTNGGTEVSELG